MQRRADLLQEGSQVSKRIGIEHVEPGSAAKGFPASRVVETVNADHDDLGQGECHPLTQGVRRRNQPAPGHVIKTRGVEFISGYVIAF